MKRRLIELSGLFRAIPRAVTFYQGSPSLAAQRAFRVWRREGIGGLRRRVAILLGGLKSGPVNAIDLYGDLPDANEEFKPKVSIIVPNYNHAPYLRQRLESIYQQTYQNIEVILLDDHSSDASVEILRSLHDVSQIGLFASLMIQIPAVFFVNGKMVLKSLTGNSSGLPKVMISAQKTFSLNRCELFKILQSRCPFARPSL